MRIQGRERSGLAGADRADRRIRGRIAVVDVWTVAKKLGRCFELDVDFQTDNWGVFHAFELIVEMVLRQGPFYRVF